MHSDGNFQKISTADQFGSFLSRGWKKVTGRKMVGEKRWVKKEKGESGRFR